MNIIFLDIDGVLNSIPHFSSEEGEKGDISDYNLQMLAKIYHSCDAKIVLSSTWRRLWESQKGARMYQYLVDSLARYDMEIMSETPVMEYNRPLEIKTWLDNFKEDILNNLMTSDEIRFVSLDDDFF